MAIVLPVILALLTPSMVAKTSQRKRKSQPKEFISIGPSRTAGAAKVYYFSDADETIVEVNNLDLLRAGNDGVVLHVSFRVKGGVITKPDYVTLNVSSVSPKPRFKSANNLSLSCSGSQKTIEVKAAQEIKSQPVSNGFFENAYYWIPFDEFVAALQCNDLNLSVGNNSFKLSSEHLTALRDIENAIGR